MMNKWREVKIDDWLVDHLIGLADGELFYQIEKNHGVELEILEDLPGFPFAVIIISGEGHSNIRGARDEIRRHVKTILGQ